MNMRKGEISRRTKETDIKVSVNLDGSGKSEISSGNGFFDHMMTLFSAHGKFDITLDCKGDTGVDFHHSAEDIGICVGKAFAQAAGDLRGIRRYSDITLPMDEALVLCAVDISGRSCLGFYAPMPTEKVGEYDTELTKEFLEAFVRNFPCAIHVRELCGDNSHHITEAIFKALGRTLSSSLRVISDEIPSTKGIL